MKREATIILLSALLVVISSFVLFSTQNHGLTGFAVNDELNSNFENVTSGDVTKEMALLAINESERMIVGIKEEGLPTLYMEDSLTEAKKTLEQAVYSEILRGEVESTDSERAEAQKAMSLLNWKKISYLDVLTYTENIKKRQEKLFLLLDRITILEKRVSKNQSNFPSNETRTLLVDARTALYEDRLKDSENLINQYEISLEAEQANFSQQSGLQYGVKNFFQKYGVYLVLLLAILGYLCYVSYKKFDNKLKKEKIKKMRIEEGVLLNLMKKAQEDRFKNNTIPQLVYNIRMKKYQERLQKIKQELPVLESLLSKNK